MWSSGESVCGEAVLKKYIKKDETTIIENHLEIQKLKDDFIFNKCLVNSSHSCDVEIALERY